MKKILVAVVAALLLLGPSSYAQEGGGTAAKKRLLLITESKGFVHSVVNRKKEPMCLVENSGAPSAAGRSVRSAPPSASVRRWARSWAGR